MANRDEQDEKEQKQYEYEAEQQELEPVSLSAQAEEEELDRAPGPINVNSELETQAVANTSGMDDQDTAEFDDGFELEQINAPVDGNDQHVEEPEFDETIDDRSNSTDDNSSNGIDNGVDDPRSNNTDDNIDQETPDTTSDIIKKDNVSEFDSSAQEIDKAEDHQASNSDKAKATIADLQNKIRIDQSKRQQSAKPKDRISTAEEVSAESTKEDSTTSETTSSTTAAPAQQDALTALDAAAANAEQASNQLKAAADKMGLLDGRSAGYGMKLILQQGASGAESEGEEAAPENTLVIKQPFCSEDKILAAAQKAQIQPKTPEYAQLSQRMSMESPEKNQYLKSQEELAKQKDQQQKGFLKYYYAAYNKGYAEGQYFLNKEKQDQANAAEAEKEKDPAYKLGKELGTLVGTYSAQQKDKFEGTKLADGSELKISVSKLSANADQGKDHNGQKQGESFKEGYLKTYNAAYTAAKAQMQQNSGAGEKMNDPNFKKGYEEGERYFRLNQDGTDGSEMDRLSALDKEYYSDVGKEKAQKDSAYKHKRAGFILGYNEAHYKIKAEKQAAAEQAEKEKLEDPCFLLGKAAGTLTGMIGAVFGLDQVKTMVKQPNALKEKGINMPMDQQTIEALTKAESSLFSAAPFTQLSQAGTGELEAYKAKRQKDIDLYKEALKRYTDHTYQDTTKNKGELAQNAKMNQEGYKEAMKVVFTHEEKSGPQDKEGIRIELNRGATMAYLEFKMQMIGASDSLYTTLDNERKRIDVDIKAHEARLKMLQGKGKDQEAIDFEKSYLQGINEAYNHYHGLLSDPKNKVRQKMSAADQSSKFSGKTENEQLCFEYGRAYGAFKLEQEKKIQAAKAQGLDVAAANEQLRAMIQQMELDLYHKMAQLYGLKIAAEPKKSAAENQAKFIKQAPDAALAKAIERAFVLFNNGYNQSFEDIKPKKVSKGNNDKHLEKGLEGLKVPKALEAKAKELYKKGAEEGFSICYNLIKDAMIDGQPFKSVSFGTKALEKIKSNADKHTKELNLKEQDKFSLRDIYIQGSNSKGPLEFGIFYALEQGMHFALGYNPDLEASLDIEKNDAHSAYQEGLAAAAEHKGNAAFAQMMQNDVEGLAEKQKNYEAAGVGSEAEKQIYDQAQKQDQNSWMKLLILREGGIVSEAIEAKASELWIGEKTAAVSEELVLQYPDNQTLIDFAVAHFRDEQEGLGIKEPELGKQVGIFSKGYEMAVAEAQTKVEDQLSVQQQYILAYMAVFLQYYNEKLPEHLDLMKNRYDALKSEVQAGRLQEDPTHEEHIKGTEEARTLVTQLQSGLITEAQLASHSDKSQEKLNLTDGDGSNDGKTLAHKHAKLDQQEFPDHQGILDEKIKEWKQQLAELEDKPENEAERNLLTSKLNNAAAPSEAYRISFLGAYWKTRDEAYAEIDALKAAVQEDRTGSSDKRIQIKSDTEQVPAGKRAVKDANTYDKIYLKTLDAALASGEDSQQKLDEKTSLADSELTDLQDRIKLAEQNAMKNALEQSESEAKKLAYYKAAEALDILDKIQRMNELFYLKDTNNMELESLEDNEANAERKQILIEQQYQITNLLKAYEEIRVIFRVEISQNIGDSGLSEKMDMIVDSAELQSIHAEFLANTLAGDTALGAILEISVDDEIVKNTLEKSKTKQITEAEVKYILPAEVKDKIFQTFRDHYQQVLPQQEAMARDKLMNDFKDGDISDMDQKLDKILSEQPDSLSQEMDKDMQGGASVLNSLHFLSEVSDLMFEARQANQQIAEIRFMESDAGMEEKTALRKKINKRDSADIQEEIDALKNKEASSSLNKKERKQLQALESELQDMLQMEERLRELEKNRSQHEEDIYMHIDQLRNALAADAGFSAEQAYADEMILDFADNFEKPLQLIGNTAYDSSLLKINGSGEFKIFANVTDLEYSLSGEAVQLSIDEFNFSAAGLHYVDQAEQLIFKRGKLLSPNLEADHSDQSKKLYNFDELAINIHAGIRNQLILNGDKLVNDPSYKPQQSSGDNKVSPDQAGLDAKGVDNHKA